jgi:Membrane carboxypeptidase/penicillin-binding protein
MLCPSRIDANQRLGELWRFRTFARLSGNAMSIFLLGLVSFGLATAIVWLFDLLVWGGISHPKLTAVQSPLLSARGKALAFLGEKMGPVRQQWSSATAPVRTRWAFVKGRYPLVGQATALIVGIFRWGLNAILFLIFSVWFGLFGPLPTTQELREVETANSTEIYTADSVLIGKYFIENRTAVSLDKVSPFIINALIATEDKRFLEHSGIDVMSYFRVAFGLFTGQKQRGGGSTLSQQLAKNLYPRQDYLCVETEKRTYRIPLLSKAVSLVINKIRENFISIRLEKVYSKPQLLSLYLNTVPFGENSFGINVASRQFFNKKPNDLTVDQAATLVGMLKGTTFYNPLRNPENAKKTPERRAAADGQKRPHDQRRVRKTEQKTCGRQTLRCGQQ